MAYPPSGGRIKVSPPEVGLALVPVGYGIHCLRTGHALMFGRNSNLDFTRIYPQLARTATNDVKALLLLHH
jgi:hypothetical protein